jgi:hypothetical protein
VSTINWATPVFFYFANIAKKRQIRKDIKKRKTQENKEAAL